MTPERYEKIGEIYHAALEVDRADRAAFLDRECGADGDLRTEVESLIASNEQASNFIATPALAVAAGLFAAGEADTMIGRTISHYKILSLLGTGGMGEVYLAEDAQLGRRVALKLLPEHFTSDSERVRRFQQEARSASALNHPNIITIHEIGTSGDRHYIATEYITGETLRERLERGRLRANDALDVASQVASALAAAHEAGIVHRDVKPENVMIRRDGYVKVLDFGLAKLTQRPEADPNAETKSLIKTDPGRVMGTVTYMSPEQARGLQVDARTDVWSLGVVLYEMVAGTRPFEGATPSDVIVSILDRAPSPLTQFAPEASAELERIVTKALAKNIDERYQTIKDMAIDLKQLKRRQEVEAEIERSAAPDLNSKDAMAKVSWQTAASKRQAAQTGQVATAATTSSIEFLIGEVKRHKTSAALMGTLFVLTLVAAGYGIYRFVTKQSVMNSPLPFQKTKVTKLTSEGKAYDAAISPDAKYVVYAVDDNGQRSLWVRQVATGSDVQITPGSSVECWGVSFSPDSNYVYYTTNEENGDGILYQVPAIGGTSRKLLAGIIGSVTFSPDGKRIAFLRSFQGDSIMMLAKADGTGEQKLASRKFPNNFWHFAAWSPDGKTIACAARSFVNGFHFELVSVDVYSGVASVISGSKWYWINNIAWLNDSSGLVVTATQQASVLPQVWKLPYPSGEEYKVTNDLNSYNGVSLTAASRSFVTVQSADVSNIWTSPANDVSQAKQLTSGMGRYDGAEGIAWTLDGKIIFRSWAKATNDLWIMEPEAGTAKQLIVDDADGSNLSVSRDGRYVAFSSNRSGESNIWRADIDGSNPRQLTSGGAGSKFLPAFSPDGNWVFYTFLSDSGPTIWKVPIAGGGSVQVSQKLARSQSISPDGKLIACNYFGEQISAELRMGTMPLEGEAAVKLFDVRLLPFSRWRSFGSLDTVQWTPDGRFLTYIQTKDGVSNIWKQPLDGSKPAPVTSFKTGRIFNFAWSPDGKSLALSRGSMTSDVLLIEDLK